MRPRMGVPPQGYPPNQGLQQPGMGMQPGMGASMQLGLGASLQPGMGSMQPGLGVPGMSRMDPRLQPKPSSQPRNYREYRLMKEEQEKRRREAEERHREAMRKLQRQEEPKTEAAAALTSSSEADKALKEAEESKGKNVKNAKDVSKDQTSSTSIVKSKDPRLKDGKKLSEAEERKAIDQMKKSFKIPKVKKTEEPEEAVTPDRSKLKVINMFEPGERKKENAREEPKNDPKNKTKKDEKQAVSAVGKKEASEPTKRETGKTKVPLRSTRFNSDSDSDHGGLTIAEDADTDEKMEIDENPEDDNAKEDLNSTPKPSGSKETGGIIDKEELTKELLKNIVATLEPREAAKLLMKAQNLEKMEKLSLEELKEFLFTQPEEEKEGEAVEIPLKKNKKKAHKKKKVKVSPGTRRSGRLRKDEEEDKEEEEEEPDNPSESETETFVIEPKEVKQRKKKGRKAKGKYRVEEEEEEEEVQDHLVSSSNIDDSNKTPEPVKKVEIKEELNVIIPEEHEIEDSKTSPQSLKAKPAKGRMAPKSKTWFPGDNRGASKRDIFSLTSPPIKHEVDVKVEEIDPDLKVFIGQEENVDELLKTDFEFNPGKMPTDLTEKFKKSHDTVSQIFRKLSEKTKLHNRTEAEQKRLEAEQKKSKTDGGDKEEVKLCSKIKLCRPSPTVPPVTPALVKSLDIRVPDLVKSTRQTLIEKLQETIGKPVKNEEDKEDQEEEEDQQLPMLLDMVKTIRKSDQRRKLPPPPLISLYESPTLKKVEQKASPRFRCSGKLPYFPDQLAEFKSRTALAEQLAPSRLSCLFRCMSFNCGFATDTVDDFKEHLVAHVEDKFGSLRCSVCLGKASESTKLIKHIMSRHGGCCYQCLHCFWRTGSALELRLHLNLFHPAAAQQFLPCRYLEGAEKKQADRTREAEAEEHPLVCPVSECGFTCLADTPDLLVAHVR